MSDKELIDLIGAAIYCGNYDEVSVSSSEWETVVMGLKSHGIATNTICDYCDSCVTMRDEINSIEVRK